MKKYFYAHGKKIEEEKRIANFLVTHWMGLYINNQNKFKFKLTQVSPEPAELFVDAYGKIYRVSRYGQALVETNRKLYLI